jgi:hypothetical protein
MIALTFHLVDRRVVREHSPRRMVALRLSLLCAVSLVITDCARAPAASSLEGHAVKQGIGPACVDPTLWPTYRTTPPLFFLGLDAGVWLPDGGLDPWMIIGLVLIQCGGIAEVAGPDGGAGNCPCLEPGDAGAVPGGNPWLLDLCGGQAVLAGADGGTCVFLLPMPRRED